MTFLISVLLVIYLFTVLLEGAASLPVNDESPSLKRNSLPGIDYDVVDEALDEVVDEAMGHARKPRAAPDLPGFKYIFIDRNGQIYRDREAGPRFKLEIAGSPGSSYRSMYAAAFVAINMTRHLHLGLFQRLAYFGSVGIFTKEEKLTVFPEFAKYANGDCGSSCIGRCEITCSPDGRKIEESEGFFQTRAVTVVDNVMCTWRDFYKNQSILVHELAHAVHLRSFTPKMKDKLKEVFREALLYNRWTIGSYAMSNENEYFAQAATVYFGVNRNQSWHAGGMNWCDGRFCATEMEGRQRLNASDPDLFRILTEVFMGGDPTIESHMTICPDAALLDQYV